MESTDEWIGHYNATREKYNGRRARLRGRLAGGFTLELNGATQMKGLDEPHTLFDGNKSYQCWAEDNGNIVETEKQ